MNDVPAEERRSDIVALAQQIFLLQVGHEGKLWRAEDPKHSQGLYEKIAREALSAAGAFITESRKGHP